MRQENCANSAGVPLFERYGCIVGYGLGQYYEYIKGKIQNRVRLDYLCDMKWEQYGEQYDGIQVIAPNKIRTLKNPIAIVFSGNPRNYNSISAMLQEIGVPYVHASRLAETEYSISGKELKQRCSGVYQDGMGNRVVFAPDLENEIWISFRGGNNRVEIGERVSAESLRINCGKRAVCTVGEGTEIESAKVFVTDGRVDIGRDCLFSYDVVIRNHDTHHIFDKETGKRINYPGNVRVGDHVLLGYGATLLGNASIGDNSVVGTMAVTSGSFPEEVVLAGSPARIVREGVLWSKDNTEFYNREDLDSCLAREALKYL